MFNILILLFPAVILLGVITSYEDIKISKIRNKYVASALLYSFVVYLIFSIVLLFQDSLNYMHLLELLVNFMISVIVGFVMWYFSLWTAGDAKLFIAFSALIPLSVYKIGYQPWFPSLTLLINIFIPAFLLMLIFMFFKMRLKHLKKVAGSIFVEFFEPKKLLNSAVYLFAIYWLIDIAFSFLGIDPGFLLRLLFTIVVFSSIQKILGKKTLFIIVAVCLLRFFVDSSIYTYSFWVNFLILVFVWKLLRSFFRGSLYKLSQELFTKKINVSRLKPGMIFAENIQKNDKLTKGQVNETKKQHSTRVIKYGSSYFIKKPKSTVDIKSYIGDEAEGLTKHQIAKIRKIGFKTVRVSQTIPFAPFIFFGALITILVKGNILILVFSFF